MLKSSHNESYKYVCLLQFCSKLWIFIFNGHNILWNWVKHASKRAYSTFFFLNIKHPVYKSTFHEKNQCTFLTFTTEEETAVVAPTWVTTVWVFLSCKGKRVIQSKSTCQRSETSLLKWRFAGKCGQQLQQIPSHSLTVCSGSSTIKTPGRKLLLHIFSEA